MIGAFALPPIRTALTEMLMSSFRSLPESALAAYEAKLRQAGYVVFDHEGDWYYNEIGAGDEFSDGPYETKADVLYSACRNLRLLDPGQK